MTANSNLSIPEIHNVQYDNPFFMVNIQNILTGENPFRTKQEKPKPLKELKIDLNLNYALNILAFLLKEKQERKQLIINKLETYGIKETETKD